MQPSEIERAKRDVAKTIRGYFETGKNKDLASLFEFYAPQNIFTKFDENAPYTRQTSEEAFVHEQATFANISDYDYKLDDLRIDFVSNVAIATFYLTYKGVFVNDYSFEAKPVGSMARVTMVLAPYQGSWKIVHSHFSSLPDWTSK